MCGYACTSCGKCGKKRNGNLPTLFDAPGYCIACGFLNGPSSAECKKCGNPLGRNRAERGEPSAVS